jgi:ectoine hydroxylase-related dioxygenase (phytanoyl-CoA dioxygenase family)
MNTELACAPGINGVISAEQEQFFRENGYLLLENLLEPAELAALSHDADALIARSASQPAPPHFNLSAGHVSGKPVLRRVDYPIDLCESFRALLGHPYILRSVERLQGRSFIPTWDAMVLKMPHEGIQVPWHQDAAVACAGEEPIFNVDFYLDDSDQDTAVWVIPGSHRWPAEKLKTVLENPIRFPQAGAFPVPVKAGSVLFHNIKLLHGSPPNAGPKTRRVIYYEFRPAGVEFAKGPHKPEYIPLKQRVLRACIERRAAAAYIAKDETPFEYRPQAPFDQYEWSMGEQIHTYKYEHRDYFRKS